MKSNIFLQVIISCLVWLAIIPARAETLSTTEAIDFASTKGEELLMTFQEPDLTKRYQKLDEMFLTYIDIDYVSRFVVGKYWPQMSDEQKQRYRDIFIKYGLSYYKTLPLDYAKNLTYEIKGAEEDNKFVNVATNVHVTLSEQEGQDVTLIFRLHKVGGMVKAVDVKVAESSLLLAYRSKFYEMIAQSDGEIEWFLEDLGDLAASMEKSLKEEALKQQNSLEFETESI